MKLRSILWIFILFTLNHSIIAQDFLESRIKKIAQKDGLASSKVNVIFKDSHNFVWLGTDNGLDRFDGKTINHFCVSSSCEGGTDNAYIKAIFESSDGRLWIGSKEGMAYFNRNSQEFIQVDSIDLHVLCFSEDSDGNLIIGAETGGYILPK
ncbi:MAG: two-component regulator propeller domain-containing protein, partial [Bacteroidota bacterium]